LGVCVYLNRVCVCLSLPEVPVLVDVPCVSAQLDDSLLYAVRERVSRHGSVSSHPPVQIEELQERPGSVLVRWCKVSMRIPTSGRSRSSWSYTWTPTLIICSEC
uniref:Uncharacterized protein n=1 Tax=Hucho hucho TaxID=62062 RepID=A0A4W5LH36_9TELE